MSSILIKAIKVCTLCPEKGAPLFLIITSWCIFIIFVPLKTGMNTPQSQ